jgi:CheY-like chemotaxis protein
VPKINRDRVSKHPPQQLEDPDRAARVVELVPISAAAVLQSTVAAVNIKKRTLSEEALRDSEARYRRLFEAARDGILILDAKTGSITDVNPFLLELLEYSRAELLGKPLWDIGLFKDDETYARQHPSTKPGRYVMLTVSDTGSGMDLETQSHIFEPFFSTKGPGQGTGLGLSTVFGIVRQSGGTIAVYSELGNGTTFKIHFPRCDEAPVVVQQEKAKMLRGGTETILLVDDAAPLRVLTRRLLEDCGYTVLDSGDPSEALCIAGEHKGSLSLMITDVVMPGFSGSVLAERLAAVRPETKVLYTSGYADDAGVQLRVPGRDYAFLEKPFTRDDLIRKVRELLDSPAHLPC